VGKESIRRGGGKASSTSGKNIVKSTENCEETRKKKEKSSAGVPMIIFQRIISVDLQEGKREVIVLYTQLSSQFSYEYSDRRYGGKR
jgi:hypothetical protein